MIRLRSVAAAAAAMCALAGLTGVAAASPTRTLDGRGNNVRHPTWGQAGARYLRIAAPAYADGIGRMVLGRPARFVSNRIFNDVGQNLFSENGVTQWGWVWGQFLDHDFGLRDERVIEIAPIGFMRPIHWRRFEPISLPSTSGARRRRTARVWRRRGSTSMG